MRAQKVASDGSGGSEKMSPKFKGCLRWGGLRRACQLRVGPKGKIGESVAGRVGVRILPLLAEPEDSTPGSGDVKGFGNYPTLAGK